MDHNTFLEKLSRLAHWRLGDLSSNQGRGRRCEAENDTFPVELVELHDRPAACKHCGKICDRPPTYTHSRESNQWLCKCEDCKLCRDPETGRFDMKPVSLYAYIRKLKRQR